MITESATEFDRLREAYIAMSKRAKYRPAAPIDGCGNITLPDEVLADPQQLGKEAAHYATEFINEGYRFWLGSATLAPTALWSTPSSPLVTSAEA